MLGFWALVILLFSKLVFSDVSLSKYRNCGCTTKNLWLDIVFAVDISAGMSSRRLMQVVDHIKTLSSKLTLDRDKEQHVRLSLVTFAKDVKMSAYSVPNVEEIMGMLGGVHPFESENEGNYTSALLECKKIIRYSRDTSRDVIIIYGSSPYVLSENYDPEKTARFVKYADIEIIAVATSSKSEVQDILREIASPRMYFKFSRQDGFVDDVLDALCQVNCYCPPKWKQLVLDNRKYGECYFYTLIDANWKLSSKQCQRLRKNGHLVHVTSEDKEEVLKKFAEAKNYYLENAPKTSYHIGLHYDDDSGKYKWDETNEELSYSKWDTGFPNLQLGKCVKAVVDGNFEMSWRNVQCSGAGAKGEVFCFRAMCQSVACDTDNYCK